MNSQEKRRSDGPTRRLALSRTTALVAGARRRFPNLFGMAVPMLRPFLTAVPIVLFILATSACRQEDGATWVVHQSRFANQWGVFELHVKARACHPGDSLRQHTLCTYTVRRDGEMLHPQSPDTRQFAGCHLVAPENVRILTIGEGDNAVGWLVGVGGICGNTFSWKWLTIVPANHASGWTYRKDAFIAKEEPVVRTGEGGFEIWSQYQEWGQTGTALSFFVPEMRVVSRDPGGRPRMARQQLPSDPATWPNLEWESPLGNFVAGISELNPELMVAVAESIDGSCEELRIWFAAHGLPFGREGMSELAAEVETIRRAAGRFGHLRLDWTRFAGAAHREEEF